MISLYSAVQLIADGNTMLDSLTPFLQQRNILFITHNALKKQGVLFTVCLNNHGIVFIQILHNSLADHRFLFEAEGVP